MQPLERLLASAGRWHGTSTLQDPMTGSPTESTATATISSLLGGRFVRMDYTWSYQGKPQEGSLLIGFDSQAAVLTGHWVDSWHMSDRVMTCTGAVNDDKTVSLKGSYAAPPGPDWGWRIDLTPDGGRTLSMVMFNIWPDGSREDLAVETTFRKERS